MMSSVEGMQPLSSASIFPFWSPRLPLPLKAPEGKQHPLDYNRNIQQYLPLPGSDSSNTPLLSKPAITNKIMCGCAEAVLLSKQTEISHKAK